MALPNQVCLVSAIFIVIFSLSSLSTGAVLPNANVPLSKVKIPFPLASSKLVGNFCNTSLLRIVASAWKHFPLLKKLW
ncbi:hypothetical protein Golax_023390 [Gossypium laxum]|uniref:Uncharacterized protein n=1 Tax=Gossypium laxum TaxID=34288 RepID=A0A7J9B1S6_9ROSI|nr:hypothetical protein [Gossypium laxum]